MESLFRQHSLLVERNRTTRFVCRVYFRMNTNPARIYQLLFLIRSIDDKLIWKTDFIENFLRVRPRTNAKDASNYGRQRASTKASLSVSCSIVGWTRNRAAFLDRSRERKCRQAWSDGRRRPVLWLPRCCYKISYLRIARRTPRVAFIVEQWSAFEYSPLVRHVLAKIIPRPGARTIRIVASKEARERENGKKNGNGSRVTACRMRIRCNSFEYNAREEYWNLIPSNELRLTLNNTRNETFFQHSLFLIF